MDHYLDIRVLPDPEFGQVDLLNALYAKLHRVLPSLTQGRVGVSFPEYGKTLGDCLRLHGTLSDLLNLTEVNWLQGMRDYIRLGEPTKIPAEVSYRTVHRVQAKSAHNKRKRSVAKGWLTEEEALVRIPDTQRKILKLPYAEMHSMSTGSRMRLYVELGPLVEVPVAGCFSAYGLSAAATIPWF
ncbi:type I-F CRISPR-associated endoribonuclease Cas6/Csy4 [Shewanella sedimentimangrovi]|uniref:Type I-F CRISPR-associated endoribonuclease Cas6/Csy4 n=1 Tax=Shewanella sedimentimangrovi TaxID=2814293 RepID=A0ABX7R1B8_9GAMM|nr:type I-F CRISPR-associated endoribonuclease Cas6/Csy4 [Shewanella sedimentimangrovi]QSX37563.1 type I-F CRISPR-associated endoribonuclease Cas6/Csy4 [Shewanella sedimentimangrovi]